ncbi:DEAD/DEAH box helicase [Sulfitobacter sp. 1A12157]|uniref:DEAD/DEAH box helicase n=1 Tax=Sulfitobacter sp. 1A12157 TaxID=3368594 RepID=UPI0037465902
MLDIVFGSAGQTVAETSLRDVLSKADLEGTLYFAYPLFDSADGQVSADALLVTREHGLVLFDLTAPIQGISNHYEWVEELLDRQDEIFRNINSKLFDNKNLVKRRELVLKPQIITYFSDDIKVDDEDVLHASPENLLEIIKAFPGLNEDHEASLNATIQRVTTIKPNNKRLNVGRDDSRGAVLKKIEAGVANLDSWQKKSAIAYPEGPQRIRGLAGSGKTIVLALKAAYLHARHPDWDIAVTYYSRALQQQFKDLVRRFMYETKKDEPDWSKIHIFHCWGSRSEPGFYSQAARAHDVEPLTWSAADRKYGKESFDGACTELLTALKKFDNPTELFDAILIDEAQDLPVSFFRMAYSVCKAPKRIVWAYDELQNLGEYSMPSPEALFGNDSEGQPLVQLRKDPNRPPQDIVLPVCYRNTPWALTVAHGLGFGIAREAPSESTPSLVQIFDEPALWQEIGYETAKGELALGKGVSLKRKPECSPAFFSDPERALISPEDAVQFRSFESAQKQAESVAADIEKNLLEDELLARDILIILPNAYTSKSQFSVVFRELMNRGIQSHLAGVNSSRDEIFVDDSIAVSHIYRAKGNEAAMVYVLNSHECFAGLELAKKRNTLFTAITRSRAWVRVYGVGAASEKLSAEFEKIAAEGFHLKFSYPNAEEIKKMRRIHRDRSEAEQKEINKSVSDFSSIIEQINKGELSTDALPEDFLSALSKIVPRGD